MFGEKRMISFTLPEAVSSFREGIT